MYSKQVFSAVTALSMVSGVVSVGCDDPTATIQSVADATQVANCDTIDGSVLIADSVTGPITLNGITKIGGDLIATANPNITSFSSTTLETIGGKWQFENLIGLQTLEMSALTAVKEISFATLTKLPQIGFGSKGITKADKIVIGDTTLDSLDGINVASLGMMNLNNNKRLLSFVSGIQSVTDQLIVNYNGLNFTMQMDSLTSIANMTIGNVTTFSAPALGTVNGSLYFDSNYFETFSLPNLTEVQTGALSFVSNPSMTNLTFPKLKSVGGGVTIANNTALEEINGFPKLAQIGGAIAFRGVFTSASLPALTDVIGGYEVVTTAVLDNSTCDALSDAKGSGVIQGPEIACEGNNDNANDDTSGANDDGGSTGTDDTKPGSAGALNSINLLTMGSLAVLGALFTTL